MISEESNPHDDWRSSDCMHCSALAACRSQIVVATPCQAGGMLALGEAPGASEDAKGEGFVGAAGKTLDRLLAAHGISRNQFGRANICRCKPPENRKPTSLEIAACLPFLASLIAETCPKVILAVGGTPTAVLCGPGTLHSKLQDRMSNANWTAKLGQKNAHRAIRDALDAVPFVVPMPHTSPLAFNRNAPSGEKWAVIAQRQVEIAVGLLKSSAH